MAENETNGARGFFASRWGVGFLVLAAVAGYFLWAEHEAHVKLAIPYLPFLLLLACPLMHLFMHRGHGGHGGHERGNGHSSTTPDTKKGEPGKNAGTHANHGDHR